MNEEILALAKNECGFMGTNLWGVRLGNGKGSCANKVMNDSNIQHTKAVRRGEALPTMRDYKLVM